MGPLRGFEPRSAAYETAILPVELQRHASAPKRRFFCFGANTPGPEFRGISRERGRRSLTRHAQGSDSPLGVAHFFTAKRESRPRQSGLPAPRLCLGGAAADLRAAGGGNGQADGARRGGFGGGRGNLRAFGRRTAGRSGRRRAKKPHTRGLPGSQGCARAPGSREKPGQAGSPSGRAPGKKRAEPGAKRGVRAGKKAGTAGAGGEKAPFCREKGGQRGCAGAKTGGESWRGV